MRFRHAALSGLRVIAPLAVSACAAKAATILTTLTICGSTLDLPNVMPPPDSGPVVLMAVPCFESQGGNGSAIPDAYRRYVALNASKPLEGVWIPFDANARRTMEADYRRLWDTGALSDLSITITDYTFPNGVIGKFVTYTAHER